MTGDWRALLSVQVDSFLILLNHSDVLEKYKAGFYKLFICLLISVRMLAKLQKNFIYKNLNKRVLLNLKIRKGLPFFVFINYKLKFKVTVLFFFPFKTVNQNIRVNFYRLVPTHRFISRCICTNKINKYIVLRIQLFFTNLPQIVLYA